MSTANPMHADSAARVACIQMEPKVGDLAANIADSVARIDDAAAQGARLLVLPELCSSGYVFETRAEACNSLFIAAADRVGTERGQPFLGCSLIVSYTGWPVAGPASDTAPETIIADLNLSEARRKRNWNDFNQILRDRRTDVYDAMLGSGVRPGWY